MQPMASYASLCPSSTPAEKPQLRRKLGRKITSRSVRTVARCIGEGVSNEIWRERQEFTYYKGSLTIKQLK